MVWTSSVATTHYAVTWQENSSTILPESIKIPKPMKYKPTKPWGAEEREMRNWTEEKGPIFSCIQKHNVCSFYITEDWKVFLCPCGFSNAWERGRWMHCQLSTCFCWLNFKRTLCKRSELRGRNGTGASFYRRNISQCISKSYLLLKQEKTSHYPSLGSYFRIF